MCLAFWVGRLVGASTQVGLKLAKLGARPRDPPGSIWLLVKLARTHFMTEQEDDPYLSRSQAAYQVKAQLPARPRLSRNLDVLQNELLSSAPMQQTFQRARMWLERLGT